MMKEEIEEFKSKNGNSAFTQKEMIMIVLNKVCKLEENMGRFVGKVSSAETQIKIQWACLTALAGLVVYLKWG